VRDTTEMRLITPSEPESFDKRKFVRHFTLIGLLLAMIYHLVLMRPPISSPGYPYNTFLFLPEDRFNDFWNTWNPFRQLENPYNNSLSIYFPATFIILFALQVFGKFVFLGFLISAITGMFLLCYYCQPAKHRTVLLSIALMLSYPFVFAVDRGNIDLLLLNLVLLWCILRSKGYDAAASLCLGLAGAAKIVPLLLLLPDLVKFRLRRLCLTAAFAAIFTGIGLLMLPDPIDRTLQLLSKNQEDWKRIWLLQGQSIPYSHCLLSVVKVGAIAYCHETGISVRPVHEWSFKYCNWIQYVGLPLMLLAGWRLRHENEWKSIFVAVAAMLLLPPLSHDYKLLYLFLPLLLFLNEPPGAEDRKLAILFGLLLIPKAYWFLFSSVSIAVIMNPILICLILWILLKRGAVRCGVQA
jgi:hypothetical protein